MRRVGLPAAVRRFLVVRGRGVRAQPARFFVDQSTVTAPASHGKRLARARGATRRTGPRDPAPRWAPWPGNDPRWRRMALRGPFSRHGLGASRDHVEKLAHGPATLVPIAELVGFASRPGAHRAQSPYAIGSRRALREGGGLCLPRIPGRYARTVHKGQGSQFDSAAVVLLPRASPVPTPEPLNTAVTRARASVILARTRRPFALRSPGRRRGLPACIGGCGERRPSTPANRAPGRARRRHALLLLGRLPRGIPSRPGTLRVAVPRLCARSAGGWAVRHRCP